MQRIHRFGSVPFVALIALVLVCTGCGSSSQSQGQQGPKHIILVMMENHGTDQIFGNTADAPYINQLVSQYGVSSKYYGVTHPSLPNYLALFSGDFQGIWDDCKAGADSTCAPEEFQPDNGYTNGMQLLTPDEITSATAKAHLFSGQNLVDQLEAKHKSWKAYMQGAPSAAFTGEYYPVDKDPTTGSDIPRKLYAQKHNPFVYFSDITTNADRMQKIVTFNDFAHDLNSGQAPDFMWLSPDQCHDMHGVSKANGTALGLPDCVSPSSGLDHNVIQDGDVFVHKTMQTIMNSPVWHDDTDVIFVWDENDYSGYAGCCNSPVGVNNAVLGGDRAPVLVVRSKGGKHQDLTTSTYNHYTLLATIEKEWNLGCLAKACNIQDADLLTPLFQ